MRNARGVIANDGARVFILLLPRLTTADKCHAAVSLAQMPQAELEKIEKLEQLRVLQAGFSILVGVVYENTCGIDTPDDYRAFVARCGNR